MLPQGKAYTSVKRFLSLLTLVLYYRRGIDIPLLDNVINVDFPPRPKLFVHRVGRAARAGRSGTAFSLFSSEELAYVLDLHLFLSLKLVPAPKDDKDTNAQHSESSSIYGKLPQHSLDSLSEHLRILTQDVNLSSHQQLSEKAYRMYVRTRPPASNQSRARAKDLPIPGIHPCLLSNESNKAASQYAAYTESLKSFRPPQTVLEMKAQGAAKLGKNVDEEKTIAIMQRKRSAHAEMIAAQVRDSSLKERAAALNNDEDIEIEPQQMEEMQLRAGKKRKLITNPVGGSQKSFRDPNFFISTEPTNAASEKGYSLNQGQHDRIEDAVLDLNGDDASDMQKYDL